MRMWVHVGAQILRSVMLLLLASGVVIVALGQAVLVVVTGGSMSPVLEPGDVCLVVHADRVVEGEIVLVDRGDGSRCLHRVVTARGGEFVTQGDANSSPDRDTCRITEIRGTVRARFATGSVCSAVAQTIAGWYTRQPIAQLEAMTEMRLSHRDPRPGRGPADCKDLRGRYGRFTPSAVT